MVSTVSLNFGINRMTVKSPTGVLGEPITTVARFAKHFTVIPGGCWQWDSPQATGYGQFYIRGKTVGAHRVSWELVNGEPTKLGNWSIDHLCRNRSCVNPAHLEQVPIGENTLRGYGPTAKHARKDKCSNGHSLVDVKPDKFGYRKCKLCQRVWSLESYYRRKSQLKQSEESE